jgi:hypothetical protein
MRTTQYGMESIQPGLILDMIYDGMKARVGAPQQKDGSLFGFQEQA